MDPMARCCPRMLRILNLSREKLVASLNINYDLRLVNCFIYDIDQNGLWAMGSFEKGGEPQSAPGAKDGNSPQLEGEPWMELRLPFGKDQTLTTEQELEWWIRGLTRLGAPDLAQSSSSLEDAGNTPETFDFRHT